VIPIKRSAALHGIGMVNKRLMRSCFLSPASLPPDLS
jgi:hypothetical protein